MRLTKGQNMPVVVAGLRLELSRRHDPQGVDADVSALLLGANGKVRDDADFVFYNQPRHASGAVVHLGKQVEEAVAADVVLVDLDRVEPEADRVALCASVDGGTFGQFGQMQLRLVEPASRTEVATFDVEAGAETALVVGELYRRQGQWKFRAVAQGYANGLAGLATDFGITVEDEPPRRQEPPVVTGSAVGPSTPDPAVRPVQSPGEERLPLDIRKRLSLRKEQITVSLRKHGGAAEQKARVILVLDASGSMAPLYGKGVVADVVERMAAVAAQLDVDGSMQAWTFASNPARLPDLSLGDLPQWIRRHVRVGQISLFRRKKKSSRLAADGQVDMAAVGIQNEEQKVISEVREFVRDNPVPEPTFVLFFSDGGVYRNAEIRKELCEAVEEPLFWQFIGLGRADYGVLQKLDTMPGRRVDNVGFFAVDDIAGMSDSDLYDRLLTEFPSWISAARLAGIVSS